ncbi:MAG TPA: N-6 DNA methylase [Flavobacterium sp.]|uniref:Eco57I restriction-modification methylase domain-containing protein n=1 Tax=unclassified Flavobacterium TaxID=196869 RepID=UPI0025BFCCB9|nr:MULTISPECIES: N-6 DNA methylase [unclassified Flavobacterium]HRE77124.1 N-6 DNA methylase [Flavobacterium sp.]
MATNINESHKKVLELIRDFEENENYYLSSKYQESEVRTGFIDKFWDALGWDVYHNVQKNPFKQEVKIEKPQRQDGGLGQKRADYAFFLAPDYKQVKFFVEAKKPSRALKQNKDDYFQTAKYGWNAGTGVSVLTDFQEFVIIDCRNIPDFDTILKNQIEYFHYQELKDIDVFEKIYWLFSREAVDAGNLATYIEDLPKPKGSDKQLKLFGGRYLTIDVSFLNYIDSVRFKIAQALYNNNNKLDKYQLTEATQKVVDRVVFMRFLEDKAIEPENILHNIGIHNHPWQKFITESKRLDAKYNGIVFKPSFIDNDSFLGADEGIFRDICLELDHTNTPYDFNYIPIHILGNIYERFLGKIIEIDSGVCKIVDKPEVRKAGGVFYTPKYVVDYIVKDTVGKHIENKKPKEIAKLSFADIACGSGSFLIGVFDYLLDYHLNYYNLNINEAKKDGCKYDNESGKWILTINQKQDILLNNIYGVDIDLQATEVTQLSLFLKMLEDETTSTANDMQVLFSTKILPDLTTNIKCGNSLIGFEIMDYVMDFGTEERRKYNPFDYKTAFPRVFNSKSEGFTVIVGNPPYVKEKTSKEIFDSVRLGKLEKYFQGKMDLWYFFTCYGLDLLKPKGVLGFIIPNNWVSNAGASKMRKKVIEDSKLIKLIDFGSYMVFEDASIQTMIMIIEKDSKTDNYSFKNQTFNVGKVKEEVIQKELLEGSNNISITINPIVKRKQLKNKFLKFDNENDKLILDNILKSANFKLDPSKEVAQGIVTPQDSLNEKNANILGQGFKKYDGIFLLSNDELKTKGFTDDEMKLIKPLYTSSELGKYCSIKKNKLNVIYTDSSFKNISKIESYPNIKNHLDKFKSIITSDNKPYGLHRARNEKFFTEEKILSLRKCVEPTFTYSNEENYVLQSYNIIKSKRINLKYLTGILNSKLIKFWLLKKGKMQGDIFQVDKAPILQIPIHKTKDKEIENQMISFVDKIIKAKGQEHSSESSHDKEFFYNYSKSVVNDIDNLVYKIYNISDEEQAIIESLLKQ